MKVLWVCIQIDLHMLFRMIIFVLTMDTKDNVLSTRVDDIVFETVEKLAKKQKVTKAKIVNQAIHLYLNGSVKEPVRQNYVQMVQQEKEIKSRSERIADREIAFNNAAAEVVTAERPKYQEAFHLTGKSTNVNMLQIMTANRRKIKGLAYDKSMEQYFHLIKPSKQNSPSRLDNG